MRNKLTWKIFVFILLNELVDIAAQILMKKGLAGVRGDFSGIAGVLGFLSGHPLSPLVWAGIGLYALNFFIWMIILSQLDLNLAVPLTSINYILLPVMALFFLNETVNGFRWLGVICIAGGVYFVSRSVEPQEKRCSP